MSNLQEIIISNYLSNAEAENIQQIIALLNEQALFRIKKMINKQCQTLTYHSYVVYSAFGGLFFNRSVLSFIQKYREGINNVHELERDDPILVIMVALFGDQLCYRPKATHKRLFIASKIIPTCMKYDIIYQNGDYEYEEVQYIETNKPKQILERPSTLFSDLQEFSKEHSLRINMDGIEDRLPSDGPYRLYD